MDELKCETDRYLDEANMTAMVDWLTEGIATVREHDTNASA